jgi:hypothetical protein
MDPSKKLKMSDLDSSMIERFRLEANGRCYANNYPYDIVLNVYRRVYQAYPERVQLGWEEADPAFETDVIYADVLAACKECNK